MIEVEMNLNTYSIEKFPRKSPTQSTKHEKTTQTLLETLDTPRSSEAAFSRTTMLVRFVALRTALEEQDF